MLITHAKVYTMEDLVLEDGYVLTENGTIAAVGEAKDAPACTEVFDAQSGWLLPGLIDGHSHLGMFEDSLRWEGDDGNETPGAVTPELRGLDGVKASDRAFEEAVDGGVTTVVTGPGSANSIGGQMAAIKTAGRRVDEMLVQAPVAMKMAFGENPKSVYEGKGRAPKTRMANAAVIREALFKTREYLAKREKGEDCKLDLKWEALAPVLKGELPVHIQAHRGDDIFTAIRIMKEFHLRYVLVHCTEGYLYPEELRAEGACAMLGPMLTDRSKPELKNLTFRAPGILNRAGVPFCLITDHPVIPENLLTLCAALSVKEGLDPMEALKAITINPAKICGLDSRLGSIKPGKDADLCLFNRHPLDVLAKTELVLVDGRRVK